MFLVVREEDFIVDRNPLYAFMHGLRPLSFQDHQARRLSDQSSHPTAVRTPHLHRDVIGLQNRLVTQIYFPNEALNATDGLFKQLRTRGDRAVARILAPTDIAAGELLPGWDIILDRG